MLEIKGPTVIAAGETYDTVVDGVLARFWPIEDPAPSLTNYGTLSAYSADGYAFGVVEQLGSFYRNAFFDNHGLLRVQAPVSQAVGVQWASSGPAARNFGSMEVSGYVATGFASFSTESLWRNSGFENHGNLLVTGDAFAQGVFLKNGGKLVNTGEIRVRSLLDDPNYGEPSDGVYAEGDLRVINDGLISAVTASATPSGAIIAITASLNLLNRGEIFADFAVFMSVGDQDPSQSTARGEIDNRGTMTGKVVLTDNFDWVVNTGTMTGDVSLGAGADAFLGGGGQHSGTIDAGDGDDLIEGGRGHQHVVGGAGRDIFVFRGADLGEDILQDFAVAEDRFDLGGGRFTAAIQSGGSTRLVHAGGAVTVSGHTGLSLDQWNALVLAESVFKGDGADQFVGTAQTDWAFGGDGDDRLDGGVGNDHLFGDGGDDVLVAGAGVDYLDGGDGFDIADYSSHAQGVISLGLGADTLVNIEGVIGSRHNDAIAGWSTNDILWGRDGDDGLTGGGGDDILYGEAGDDHLRGDAVDLADGDDQLYGGEGNDRLEGGLGQDLLEGGAGDDILEGGGGADRLDGGEGQDTASYALADGVIVDLHTGRMQSRRPGGEADGDVLISIEHLTGSQGDDYLSGDVGANRLEGGAGDDLLRGRGGDDLLIGGDGQDTAIFRDPRAAYQITFLDDHIIVEGPEGRDTLFDIELLRFADVTVARPIIGAEFTETLVGSEFDDFLDGRGGDDQLWGKAGADRLIGGAGRDTAIYEGSDAAVRVDLALGLGLGGHAEGDTLEGVENLRGSSHDDELIGDAGDNVIEGGAGADRMLGGGGRDTLSYEGDLVGVRVDRSRVAAGAATPRATSSRASAT